MEHKINCESIPQVFFSNKDVAKKYFKQFGRLKRIVFKPKSSSCTVEYAMEVGALNALANAGEYEGEKFRVKRGDRSISKRRLSIKSLDRSVEREKKRAAKAQKDDDPDWLDDPDVIAELEAMGGLDFMTRKTYDLRPEVMQVDDQPLKDKSPSRTEKTTKLKRSWKTEVPKTPKKKRNSTSSRQIDLIKIIKQQAFTLEDKLKILDARDKLIRLITKKKERKKSKATVGICPDMCPEKERILRQLRHQVALFEQEFGGRVMNPSLAVKQYSRSSADQETPLPHELRPVNVLQMTMAYLMHQIMSLGDSPNVNFAEWYHFLWDRTRGIRKDITQQELCSQGSVQLVEQCARFHIHCSARLVAEDPSVFDQKINTENLTKCLQTLKYMYHDLLLKGESCPNESEFRAYVILLNLNDGNFMWEVQKLRQDIQKSSEVQFALHIYSAIDKNNYVRFFKLVHSTTYLNACILMRYFVQVRTRAIKAFLKSFSPRIPHTLFPLTELTKILAFENIDATVEFLETHGLIVNTEKTHVILDRNNFKLPEYPYQLERAINIVESKRKCSLGEIICGAQLPPKDFEYHIPEESFDIKGYLKLDGYLKEQDIKVDPSEVAQEVEDEEDRKLKEERDEILRKLREEQEEEDLLYSPVVTDSESNDVFKKKPNENDEQEQVGFDKASLGIQETSQSVFGTPQSIFSKGSSDVKIISDRRLNSSIFGNVTPSMPFQSVSNENSSEGSPSPWQKPTQDVNIFGKSDFNASKSNDSIFGTKAPQKSIFSAPVQTTTSSIVESQSSQVPIAPGIVPFNQGFPSQTTNIFMNQPSPIFKTAHDSNAEIENKKQAELEKQMKLKKEIEERQKILELEKQKLLEEEKRLLRQKQEEIARREEEKRHKIEAEKIKREQLRKLKLQEEERERREKERREAERVEKERIAKENEIVDTVKKLIAEVVNEVEIRIRDDKLAEIASKIRTRSARKYANLWHMNVLRNKRKRKALDCSPCWIYSKSLKEHAADLSMNSQETTLRFIKRYRRGKPYDLNPIDDDVINRIAIQNLTYPSLIKRLYEFNTMLPRDIYWKVTISLPDSKELSKGLRRIEGTLEKYIQWERRVNNTLFIEQIDVTPSQTITYCIEKQQGITKGANDANGYIFIANDFNEDLCNRIIESLRDFGVYVKVPVVIILQNYEGNKIELKNLIDEGIVSDYTIIVTNFKTNALISSIDNGLVFLSSKIERSPTLEMDTLKSFLDKYLCNDIWKRAMSFSKWNDSYKSCLKKPNVVIHLYNECVSKLKEIILNKVYVEYARFPEVFKNFLFSDIPNSLPCDYRYFPIYWTNSEYAKYIADIMESLFLPKFTDEWPQGSELELELTISKYCTRIFKKPEKPFYKIMSVILSKIDPNVNFEDIKDVNWIDIIEVLSTEIINQIDFSLNKTEFRNKSVFNQFTVVYDPKILHDYKVTDWFYINNPVIEGNITFDLDSINKKKKVETESYSVNIDFDIDKALSDLLYKGSNKEKALKFKEDMKSVNLLLKDLENSIEIDKKISIKFENVLQTIIEEN